MTIYEKVFRVIEESGFSKIEVNIKNLKVGYKILDDSSYVVAIFDELTSDIMEEQYKNITRQLYDSFLNHYGKSVNLLSILCTDEIEKAKLVFSSYPEVWFINKKNLRLLIYENQIEDFLSIRDLVYKSLEQVEEGYVNNSSDTLSNRASNINSHTDRTRPDSEYMYVDRNTAEEEYEYDKRDIQKFGGIYLVIILLNIIIHIVLNLNSTLESAIINDIVLYWRACFYEKEYYRLFTYMFLHSNIEHLANNMFLLFVLGKNVEMVIGKLKFTSLYILSGILAGIGSISYNMYQNNNVVSVGASGAIFGIVGGMAYLVLSNKDNVRNISKRQILLFIIFSLYGGFTSSRIDNAAHITGLITGIILTAIIDKIGGKPRKG